MIAPHDVICGVDLAVGVDVGIQAIQRTVQLPPDVSVV
jgi:hypothetical protein